MAKLPNKNKCRSCEYFTNIEDDNGVTEYGTCHRYPPKFTSSIGPGGGYAGFKLPSVNADSFCGEFQ